MQPHSQPPPATALDSAFASLHLAPSESSATARADPLPPQPAPRQARTPSAISVTPWMRPLFRTDQDRGRPPIDLCARTASLARPPLPSSLAHLPALSHPHRLDEEVASFVASVRPTKGEQRLRLAALTCLVKVVDMCVLLLPLLLLLLPLVAQ